MCQRHDNDNNALLEAERFGGHDKRYVAEEEIWGKKKKIGLAREYKIRAFLKFENALVKIQDMGYIRSICATVNILLGLEM